MIPLRARLLRAFAALLLLGWASVAAAENFKIIKQDLDAERHGYTVMRVWGSHREMGRAMGAALADDILKGWQEVKTLLGPGLGRVRAAIAGSEWPTEGILEELLGMVEGVKSVRPDAELDVMDIKLYNTYSDWAYTRGCRSHSAWGRYVTPPVKTLSTRRLDYRTPFRGALHHVLCAWEPDGGSPRWVNLAWPGYVTVITAVNERGTLVALHDWGRGARFTKGAVPRSVMARHLLSGFKRSLPASEQPGWVEGQAALHPVATSGFIAHLAPNQGVVFTCAGGQPCTEVRRPAKRFFDGEAMLVTNAQTDGRSAPRDDDFMAPYYAKGHPKTLADHFGLMGRTGLHLLSVAYRGRNDMTLWFHGRGRRDRVELEWSELFTPVEPRPGLPR